MEGWLNKDFVGRGGGDEIDGGDPWQVVIFGYNFWEIPILNLLHLLAIGIVGWSWVIIYHSKIYWVRFWLEDVGIIFQYPLCCALGCYVQIRLYFSCYWQKMKEMCVYLALKIYRIAVGFSVILRGVPLLVISYKWSYNSTYNNFSHLYYFRANL